MYNFDPYNVLLSIATNIPVLLMTAFVLQGHIWVKMIIETFVILFKTCYGLKFDQITCKIFIRIFILQVKSSPVFPACTQASLSGKL